MLAARHGHSLSVSKLISAGSEIKAKDKKGNAIHSLILASENGDTDTIRFLLAANPDVKAKNLQGNTALHYCALGGHTDSVKLLLDYCKMIIR